MRRIVFGGGLVLILLGIYLYAIYVAVSVVNCVSTQSCTEWGLKSFTPGLAIALNLVGGLVSALVIAELAITDPGKPPGGGALGATPPPWAANLVMFLTWVYLFAWVASGLTAFVVGFLLHPDVLPALSDVGQAWAGLAVAAGYSYFGIRRT